jgi:DNA repair protein SbcC/Rad50
MIPVALSLAGFLSWRDRATVRFDVAARTLITGPNGSGKSALFDAITFALFGTHRGGSGHADLIHKDAQALTVEFELTRDNERFRILRTVKRGRTAAIGTQIVQRWSEDTWTDIPETHKRAGFDAWMDAHLGLRTATFTAACLLAQGRADRLLDATPKGRAEILADVVDLASVQAQHTTANTERLKAKAVLDALGAQESMWPPVTDDETAAAIMACSIAVAECQTIQERLDELHADDERWQHASVLDVELRGTEARLREAEQLLEEATRIEQDHDRYRELLMVLPAAETVVLARSRIADSERKSDRLLKQQDSQKQLRASREASLATAKSKQTALRAQLTAAEAALTRTTQRLRELAGAMQTLKLLDESRAESLRLMAERDASTMPSADELKTIRQQIQQAIAAERWLPLAERHVRESNELAEARDRFAVQQAARDHIRHAGEVMRRDHDRLAEQSRIASERLTEIVERWHQATARQQLAMSQLQQIEQLTQEPNCTACGQPLTPEHRNQELSRRRSDLETAATVLAKHDSERAEAERIADDARRRLAATAEQLAQLRQEFAEHSAELAQTTSEIKRLTASLALIDAERPAALSKLTIAELSALAESRTVQERLLKSADAAIAARRAIDQQLQAFDEQQSRLSRSLPIADIDRLRIETREHQAAEVAGLAALKADRAALESLDREIEAMARDAHSALTEITDITGRLRTEEATRVHARETIERAMQTLPPEWQMRVESAGLGDYTQWLDAKSALARGGIIDRFTGLTRARTEAAILADTVARLRTDRDAITFVTTSRDTLTAERADLRAKLAIAQANADHARRYHDHLETARKERARWSDQVRSAEEQHAHAKREADRLGRDGLQRDMVRTAEAEIVAAAQAVLARTTDGDLSIRLADAGDADAALAIEVIHAAATAAPIDAAFLSGSQRFRVAIALALGLQKVLGEEGCLLLDEGFGGLDPLGRRRMVDELVRLSTEVARLIVISPDDEFADHFGHVIRVNLVDGSSRVVESEKLIAS